VSRLIAEVRRTVRLRTGQATSTPRRAWVTTFILLVICYALTAHWYGLQSIDSIAAAWPSWQLAHHGNVWLEHIKGLPALPWFSTNHGHLISNRTPGVILIGVPLQVLLMPFGAIGPLYLATATAVVVTAAAVANLALLATRLGATPRWAMSAALLAGLGTGLWGNASGELWPHGPDALWLSLAALALSRNHWSRAGAALGTAVLTRPHFILVVAALAATLLVRRRRLRPALQLSLPVGASLLLLVLWNGVVYRAPGITGGYSEHIGRFEGMTWVDTANHIAGSLVSPLRGVLVFSPFVLPLAVLIWRERRALPDWTLGLAVGALAYQCAQWRLTTLGGGTGFYGYRYFLEPLVLLYPAAVVAALRQPDRLGSSFRYLAAFSVAVTTVGAFFYRPSVDTDVPNPWRTWGTAGAVTNRGHMSAILAIVTLVSVWVALAVRRRGSELEVVTSAVDHASSRSSLLEHEPAPQGTLMTEKGRPRSRLR
jgi:hypothetical protein